jgi:hypothetical protein
MSVVMEPGSSIIMDSVDSDKLKPYLRGESEGDSMNDSRLLDSNGSTGVPFWRGVTCNSYLCRAVSVRDMLEIIQACGM